jgi:hypothetical protein
MPGILICSRVAANAVDVARRLHSPLKSAETGQPNDKVHPRSPMMLEASDIANWLHNARRRLFAYRTRQRVAITPVTFVSALLVSKLSIRRLD